MFWRFSQKHGTGNFKLLLLLHFSSELSQALLGRWLSFCNRGFYLFLVIGQALTLFMTLWNFNMWVKGKKLKCAERKGWKFGTYGPGDSTCRLPFIPEFLIQFGALRCNAKFPMFKFAKATAPRVFIQFHPSFMENINQGRIQAITFSLPNFKIYNTVRLFLYLDCVLFSQVQLLRFLSISVLQPKLYYYSVCKYGLCNG